MIIKKFLGKTEEDAIALAKKELGNNVVVLNVKKNVKKKGLFGAFKPKLVEVTVALEEESETLERTRREAERKQAAAPAKTESPEKKDAQKADKASENIEKRLDTLQTLLETQIKNKKSSAVSEKTPENAEEKKEEVPEEKDPKTSPEDEEQTRFLNLLHTTMLENEVDEKYAEQIMEEIEKIRKPNMPMDYLLANIYQKMILKFGKADGISPSENQPKVVIFMGPTGVGKTTTIAKVASSYSVEEKKKIALLTADTYRIAAAEQLRTYANILEVPFRVVYTSEDMKNAIADFKDYDYIFVDTAGHSHQNVDQVDNMKELLDAAKEVADTEIFLVLSATTKYRDLLKIADTYKSITDYRLIFTKLDETSCVGNLLNIKLFTDAAISYVTYGQNVPDDIEAFNAQKTVKQLLGGKH
ncbi:MAG: flagellar biosynthesis protein FlhF [Acetatifactor sp.]|nr:flagellar biosynthesis protein FlhF [Acetatifactor sp.]